MLGELDIPFDVFTTFFAHMLTLSTVVLIQVYINYIKKLLKVGFILVTIFVIASIGSQPRANLSLSLQCRCCYRDNCGRSDSSDLSAYASFASSQTKSALVLVFPAPPIAVAIAQSRMHAYNVDNAVAVVQQRSRYRSFLLSLQLVRSLLQLQPLH